MIQAHKNEYSCQSNKGTDLGKKCENTIWSLGSPNNWLIYIKCEEKVVLTPARVTIKGLFLCYFCYEMLLLVFVLNTNN